MTPFLEREAKQKYFKKSLRINSVLLVFCFFLLFLSFLFTVYNQNIFHNLVIQKKELSNLKIENDILTSRFSEVYQIDRLISQIEKHSFVQALPSNCLKLKSVGGVLAISTAPKGKSVFYEGL
ncbi:hypothetical protein J7J60_01900 [bacterium]|nr:hypothetical protein [bacterium]